MKKTLICSLVALVCTACVLMVLNAALRGVAADREQMLLQQTMEALLPGSKTFTEDAYTGEDATIVRTYKGEGGFVVETCTNGYVDEVAMLIGVTDQGGVRGLMVTELHETFGLGAKARTDTSFLQQFLNVSETVSVGEPAAADAVSDATSSATGSSDAEAELYVDAISGATVTSKAVARSVNAAIAYATGADAETAATTWGG